MNKVGCALKPDTAPLSRRDILLASLAALTGAQARSRIRLGCQTRAYGSPLKNRAELLAALADLHDLGYEGFETNFASLADSFADPRRDRPAWLAADRTPHRRRSVVQPCAHRKGAGADRPTRPHRQRLRRRVPHAQRERHAGNSCRAEVKMPRAEPRRKRLPRVGNQTL